MVTMSAIACCHKGCGASVCFTPEIEQRLRRTHELWMCPFGHEQHFTTETAAEIRVRQAERARDRWMAHYEDLVDETHRCPFEDCGWRSHAGKARFWRSMLGHFAKAHGDELSVTKPKLAAVS